MNLNNLETLQKLSILTLIGGIIFLGCTAGNQSSTSQNQSRSTPQANEAEDEKTVSPVATAGTQNGEPPAELSQEASITDTTTPDTVLVLAADDVPTLDPYHMVSIHPEGSVASHLWDTLTLLNNDLQVEPHLAESWRLVNNFTWEFKLREGIVFHNGEPLNAEAVRFSIERAQSISNSLETFAIDVNLEQVEVVDDYTLRLKTHQPVANLPYHLAFLEILPPLYYAEIDPQQAAIAPVGSGPYQLNKAKTVQGEVVVLEAMPDYWKGPPAFSKIIFQAVPSTEERLALLRNDQATLVTDLPPMLADRWDLSTSELVSIESTHRILIGIRIKENSPLADKRVRQALNYGVNVEQVTDEWLEGYGERYGSWANAPSNNPELAPWPYDPELARELLAEAGYSEGITLTLRTPVGVYRQDVEIANTIAQQLKTINITVQVETVSNWGIYVRELLAGKTGSLFLLRLNSRGDGLEDVKNLSSDFTFNLTGWRNEAFEELVERAITTFNEDARSKILHQAQIVAYNEAPWIWLWRQYNFYGVSQSLEWTPRPDGLIYLYKSATVQSD